MSTDVPPPADGQRAPENNGIPFGHFLVPRRADGSPWELGRGAMGVTYRAFDTSLRTEVALKVIASARVQEESARRRFQREARAAAKIRHPNVASVLYLGDQGGEYFYAMEFIAGRSLESLVKETAGPLPPLVAVALAAQAAAALNAAHRREVVHRDLKPANLMLLEGDALDHEDARTAAAGRRQLKMIDFGLARSFGAGREEDSLVTQTFAGFLGTPAYASPEQCAGEDTLDGRSDLYSLGVILWQMLTGQLPFTGRMVEVLGKHQFQPPPFAQLQNLPAPLVKLLTGLLAKDPAERWPQSAGELRTILDDLLSAGNEVAVHGNSHTHPAVDAPVVAIATPEPVPSSDTTDEPSIGTTLAIRYRLGQEIGHGDGGRLFLAADNADGQERPVAVKLLPPGCGAADSFLERTAAALDVVRQHPHPAILTHFGGLETSGPAVFYVREWAEGFSLLELLRARGSLRAAEVLRLLDALPEALDFASAAGFLSLEPALHKLFVTPAAIPNGEKSGEDWLGSRSLAVEGWPAFALKLNPLSFPPAVDAAADTARDAELTRLEKSPSAGDDPVTALARLTRELLGGAPGSVAPLSALTGEANAVLRRALDPNGGNVAFGSCAAFWAALRAAGANPAPPLPRRETSAAPVAIISESDEAEAGASVPAIEPSTSGRRFASNLHAKIEYVAAPEPPASRRRRRKALWLSLGVLLLLGAAGAGGWQVVQILFAAEFAKAYNERGYDYHLRNEEEQAIAYYSKAIRLDPQYAEAYTNRGTAYIWEGKREQAMADFSEAIRLNPKSAEAYDTRGNAYIGLSKYEQAIADFSEAIRLNPQYAEAYCDRGTAYRESRKYEQAIADYSEAIRLNPEYSSAYDAQALARQAIGQTRDAAEDHAKAQSIRDKNKN